MSPTTDDVLLDRRDLMSRWRCSLASIKRYEASGHLKAIRIGRRLVRYRLTAVLAFEEANGSDASPG